MEVKHMSLDALEEHCATEQNSLDTYCHCSENAILSCTSNIKYTYPALFSVL